MGFIGDIINRVNLSVAFPANLAHFFIPGSVPLHLFYSGICKCLDSCRIGHVIGVLVRHIAPIPQCTPEFVLMVCPAQKPLFQVGPLSVNLVFVHIAGNGAVSGKQGKQPCPVWFFFAVNFGILVAFFCQF